EIQYHGPVNSRLREDGADVRIFEPADQTGADQPALVIGGRQQEVARGCFQYDHVAEGRLHRTDNGSQGARAEIDEVQSLAEYSVRGQLAGRPGIELGRKIRLGPAQRQVLGRRHDHVELSRNGGHADGRVADRQRHSLVVEWIQSGVAGDGFANDA